MLAEWSGILFYAAAVPGNPTPSDGNDVTSIITEVHGLFREVKIYRSCM